MTKTFKLHIKTCQNLLIYLRPLKYRKNSYHARNKFPHTILVWPVNYNIFKEFFHDFLNAKLSQKVIR